MVAVVLDAELPLDHLGHAQRRPEVRPVSMRQRPLHKIRNQTLFLPVRQQGRPARRGLGPQRLPAAPRQGVAPSHHRTGVAADATSRFIQRISILDQRHSAKPPPLQFRR